MIDALLVKPSGERVAIQRIGERYQMCDGSNLPDGHYAFDRTSWRHVVYGPHPTREQAGQQVGKKIEKRSN